MASVFLSYDHRDSANARQVAQALEKRGHDVWWDRHIQGGAQYAKEIEQAIARADMVVVLWSKQSVESEWVRDEAMAGKARGRLVPASIDGSEPPIGFRQFQMIDLSSARGRKWTQGLEALERAIAALGGESINQPIRPASGPGLSRRPVIAAALFAFLVLVAAGLLWWKPWSRENGAPVVTVEARDSSAASADMANSLLVQLGSLQASRGDLLQLGEPNSDVDPDLILKVASQRGASASVALIDGNDSTLLWSKEFESYGVKAADLRQQVAYATGKALECAAQGSSGGGKALDDTTYKLYLNGCVDLATAGAQQTPALIETFRKITYKAPDFAPGWSGLLIVQIDAHQLAGLKDPRLHSELRTSIDKAREHHPDLVEAYMAESWIQQPRPIGGWMHFTEKAVEVDPNHPGALLQRATGLLHVGRMEEAVADSRKAVEFDPLSPSTRSALIYALLSAGQPEAARKELAEIERLWPGSSSVNGINFQVENQIGDPERALAIARSGDLPIPASPIRILALEAKASGSPEAADRAIRQAAQELARSPAQLGTYVQALAEFGRTEEALKALLTVDPSSAPGAIISLFRPSFDALRKDVRFMNVAKRFELTDYWLESGKWPDFCSEPGLPYDCKAEAAKLGA